jgi:hypothetical protein
MQIIYWHLPICLRIPTKKKTFFYRCNLKFSLRGSIQFLILDSTTRADFWKMFSSSRKRGVLTQIRAYRE